MACKRAPCYVLLCLTAGALVLNDTASSISIEQLQHNAETEPLPFQSGSIDAVFFLEVLEHLQKDPFFAILEMHRVLKPNGEAVAAAAAGVTRCCCATWWCRVPFC